jgi:hypothetical protein
MIRRRNVKGMVKEGIRLKEGWRKGELWNERMV